MNRARLRQLTKEAIDRFHLDLSGLVVFTEAASGSYVVTPLMAAAAGADHVFAVTRDSPHGPASVVEEETMRLAKEWGIARQVEIVFEKRRGNLGNTDILTNVGFVRPVDRATLHMLKPTAAIPLMWETWEYRGEDLDLAECFRLGIPVLGTDENTPGLDTFGYLGPLALKLAFELSIEVFQSRAAVVGQDPFAKEIIRAFSTTGAEVYEVEVNGGWPSELPGNLDLLIIADHEGRRTIVGSDGLITPEKLQQANPGVAVLHLTGIVDREGLERAGIPRLPETLAPPRHMAVTTGYLGPKPVIDLHAAGLKVGAASTRRLTGLCGSHRRRTLAQSRSAVIKASQTERRGGHEDRLPRDTQNGVPHSSGAPPARTGRAGHLHLRLRDHRRMYEH